MLILELPPTVTPPFNQSEESDGCRPFEPRSNTCIRK